MFLEIDENSKDTKQTCYDFFYPIINNFHVTTSIREDKDVFLLKYHLSVVCIEKNFVSSHLRIIPEIKSNKSIVLLWFELFSAISSIECLY